MNVLSKKAATQLQQSMGVLSFGCGKHFGSSQHFEQGLKGKVSYTHNGFVNYRADFIVLSEVVNKKKLTRANSEALEPMSANRLASFLRMSDFWRKYYRGHSADVYVKNILQEVIDFTSKNAQFLTIGAAIVENKKDYAKTLMIDIVVDQELSGAPNTSIRIALDERHMFSRKEELSIFQN